MDLDLQEILGLATRWFHVFAAILWIGGTAFFSWLDARMTAEADPATGKEEVWMVHSGGFYVVEKQKVPKLMPRTLHWFKWEAGMTWLSGFLLLVLVYYWSGSNLVEEDSGVSVGTARAVAIGALIVSWAVYDLLWMSPIGRNEPIGAVLCFALLVGAMAVLSRFLAPRAAFFHAGAIMGTIMAANVWMRIIPAQRKMVEATRRGEPADLALGVRAKNRSRHNTFMGIPVTLVMISSHFPTTTYGHKHAWAMLAAFVLLGFGARKLINMSHAAPARPHGSP